MKKLNNKSSKKEYLAIIDAGSNSFKLIIVKIINSKEFDIIATLKESLRLINGIDRNNNLTLESFDRARNCIHNFKKNIENYDCDIIAVGTEFLRKANNSSDFIDYIFSHTGIKIKILTEIEEGYFAYKAVNQLLEIDSTNLIIDIGGGSTELIAINFDGEILSNSIPIAGVNLSKEYFPDGIYANTKINECKKHINSEFQNAYLKLKENKIKHFIGTSSSIRNLILLSNNIRKVRKNNESVSFVSYQDFNETLIKVLAVKDEAEIKELDWFDKSRADIMFAVALLLNELFEIYKPESISVVPYSIREGIIFNYLEEKKIICSFINYKLKNN